MARRRVLVSTLVIMMMALPALGLAGEADNLLQQGILHYKMGSFAKSQKILYKASKKAAAAQALAKIYFYMGLNHGVLGKMKEAEKAFKAALTHDPLVDPDKLEIKPAILALLQKVRQDLKGKIKVTADQQGATVKVDGKALGPAPYEGELPAGKHKVVVTTADGMYHKEMEVVILVNETREVKTTMAFVGAKLKVVSSPAGATVSLDNKELGKTPLAEALVTAGKHLLRVELKGHEAHSREMDLKSGSTVPVAVTLKPASAAPVVVEPMVPAHSQPGQQDTGGRKWPVWTIVSGSAALALAGVGIGMGLSSQSAFDEYSTTNDQTRYYELQDNIKTYDTVMAVTLAGAGVAAVGAVMVYLFVDHPAMKEASDGEGAELRLISATGGALLRYDF